MKLSEIEVSEPQNEIINSTKELNLFMAGVGSGKSHIMGVVSATYIINFPRAHGLMCANTHDQLSRSTLTQVFKVWARYFGLKEDIHYVVDKQPLAGFRKLSENLKQYRNVISFANGARIYLASLDNYKAVDGLEVSWAQLDETKDSKEEAVKETIFARLRGNEMFLDENNELWDHEPDGVKVVGFNPLYIYTSPAKVQWLNDLFYINDNLEIIQRKIFDKDDYYVGVFEDRMVVISSTYHNEHNLPSNYIATRRKVWDDIPGLTDMLIYASPTGKTGGEWYSNYDREVHVKDRIQTNKELPVHISWDFNVNPYMPALAFQLDYKDDDSIVIKILKEYALEHPRNTTGDVCDEIKIDYEGLIDTMYIYGDASGKNRHTAVTDKSIRHNYDVVETKLAMFLFHDSIRVPRSNPPISGRRILMNRIMSGNSNITVEIDSSCKYLIQDVDFGKEGPNGEYLKPKTRDSDKGISFEKYGHHSDAFIYFCWYNFNYLIKIE